MFNIDKLEKELNDSEFIENSLSSNYKHLANLYIKTKGKVE